MRAGSRPVMETALTISVGPRVTRRKDLSIMEIVLILLAVLLLVVLTVAFLLLVLGACSTP